MASYIITISPRNEASALEHIIGTVRAKSPRQAVSIVYRNDHSAGSAVTAHPYDKAPEKWKARADVMGSVVTK
jgi:hypothetical protein